METIFFYITFIILIFSSIGHGIIFGKLFNIKADLNIGTYGLLGLANLTLISYISVFFFEDKSYNKIALGGINNMNIKLVLLSKFCGVAGISLFKKKGPK